MRDAVDQERHVVVDDLDDRVGRLPAVLLELRVVDAQLGRARPPLLAEAQLRQRGAVEVERVALGQILRRHVAEISPDEPLRHRRLMPPEPIAELQPRDRR